MLRPALLAGLLLWMVSCGQSNTTVSGTLAGVGCPQVVRFFNELSEQIGLATIEGETELLEGGTCAYTNARYSVDLPESQVVEVRIDGFLVIPSSKSWADLEAADFKWDLVFLEEAPTAGG